MTQSLGSLSKEIRACTACPLPHTPRPVFQASSKARICIAGQAPGTRVHASGVPFTDPSGDRLREWLGVTPEQFYNPDLFAIVPMGFCFPGLNDKGGDLPPRKECAPLWREKLFDHLPNIDVTLLVGGYAQKWHLRDRARKTLTETVQEWREFGPEYLPMPHPSWRNNVWLKKNPWFETEVLPFLRKTVADRLDSP
jgi:uracil-DNA glycosylase